MPFQNWSTTAADNDDADSQVNWLENQLPSTVNNSARQMMAALAAWRDLIGGAKTSTGAANAYVLSTGLSLTGYINGFLMAMEANFTNSGASTISVDGLGTKPLRTTNGVALSSGAIVAGGIYLLVYENGADVVQVLNANVATTRALLGLDTTDSPQFLAINLGSASDTTLARSGPGDATLEGNQLYRAGGTDVPVTDGGTGSSSASGARTNLGAAIKGAWEGVNAQTASYTAVLTDTGKLVTMSNASANQFTIPPNSSVAFPTESVISIQQIGAGVTTVKGGTGVTLNGVSTGGGALSLRYGAVTITKIATDTWLMAGAHGTVA